MKNIKYKMKYNNYNIMKKIKKILRKLKCHNLDLVMNIIQKINQNMIQNNMQKNNMMNMNMIIMTNMINHKMIVYY